MSEADFLVSPLLQSRGFQHAFFTRRGGVSQGLYESLNFSVSVGDLPAAVEENCRRAADALGVVPSRLYYLSQVHGTTVCEVRGDEPAEHVLQWEGDALVSSSPGVACGVRSADCIPILIADLTTGRVAAVHAGWRGVAANIVRQALAALGGSPQDWIAAIGPHISKAAFEVGDDVARQLAAASTTANPVDWRGDGKPHVDLRAIVRAQLCAEGTRAEHIDDVAGCSYLEPERFFSFRRDGQRSGRHLSAICPRPPRG